MKSREIHLTTAYIALVCCALGWVSWGVIAIPGVMIAGMVKSDEPATSVAIKAALRVGYASIAVGVVALATMALTYLGLIARMKMLFSGSDQPGLLNYVPVQLFSSPEAANHMTENWAWAGGFFLVALLLLVLLLPLVRRRYADLQSARIVRSNMLRWICWWESAECVVRATFTRGRGNEHARARVLPF